MKKNKIYAMIPARIGSTRFKKKNLALLNGKPMIEYSIEASKKNPDQVFNTNLVGTYNILKKCIKDKSNIIFLSSSG